MEIRVERAGERATVLEVQRKAFQDDVYVRKLVEALITDDPGALSLVAVLDGEIVGHVLFTKNWLDAPRQLVAAQVLSPIAVLPEHQSKGIGGALIKQGVNVLDERGVPMVFLEGNPKYYRRFGFTAGGEHGFRKPSLRIPDEAFQVLLLSAYESWMTGTLVYARAFWDCDCVGLRDPDA
jgi:putative acetyltransferase